MVHALTLTLTLTINPNPNPNPNPSPNNQLLSASGDGEAKLWDVKTGAVVASFAGHSSDCLCLSVAPDGPPKIFATGGLDNTVLHLLWLH